MSYGNGHDERPPTDYVRADRGSSVLLQIDKGVGRQFLLIIWISAIVTAAALVGLVIAWDGYRHMRQHVNVLQYDLMDLRSKTGHAHENVDPPQEVTE